jgi:hypothetical protein
MMKQNLKIENSDIHGDDRKHKDETLWAAISAHA